jgi:hypothetical protein
VIEMTATESAVETVITQRVRLLRIGHFLLHYGEMCVPMCIGFAVGDLVYFWAAGLLGYSEALHRAT